MQLYLPHTECVTSDEYKTISHSRHTLGHKKVTIDVQEGDSHVRIVGYFYQNMFVIYGYCVIPSRQGLGSYYLTKLRELVRPNILCVTGILCSAMPFWRKMLARGLISEIR